MKKPRFALFAISGILVAVVGVVATQQSSFLSGDLTGDMMMPSSFGAMQSSDGGGIVMSSFATMEQSSQAAMQVSSMGGMMSSSDGGMMQSSSMGGMVSSQGTTTVSSMGGMQSSGGAVETAASSFDSSYVSSTLTCSDTTSNPVAITVSAKTMPTKFTKGKVTESVAARCDRAAAEISARDQVEVVFRNACPSAPPCALGCDYTNYRKEYKKPLPMVLKTAEIKSTTAMSCAGGKAYVTTATVTKENCTTVNVCTVPKPPMPLPR